MKTFSALILSILIVPMIIPTIAMAGRIRDPKELFVGQAVNYVSHSVVSILSSDLNESLIWPSIVRAIDGNKVTLQTTKAGELAEVNLSELAETGEIWSFNEKLYIDNKKKIVSENGELFMTEIHVGDIVSLKTSNSLFAKAETAEVIGMTSQGDATFNFAIKDGETPSYRNHSLYNIKKVLTRRELAPSAVRQSAPRSLIEIPKPSLGQNPACVGM